MFPVFIDCTHILLASHVFVMVLGLLHSPILSTLLHPIFATAVQPGNLSSQSGRLVSRNLPCCLRMLSLCEKVCCLEATALLAAVHGVATCSRAASKHFRQL